MKIKKFQKKVGLKKETVANLNSGQLGNVKGGIELTSNCTFCYCDTCGLTCSTRNDYTLVGDSCNTTG